MRPPSIVRFEQAVYGSLGLSILSILVSNDSVSRGPEGAELPLSHVIVFQAVGLGFSIALIWLIARRASRIAKWLFVLLAVASLALQLAIPEWVFDTEGVEAAIIVGQDLLTFIALWMLFTPDSRAWFKRNYTGPYGDIFS